MAIILKSYINLKLVVNFKIKMYNNIREIIKNDLYSEQDYRLFYLNM